MILIKAINKMFKNTETGLHDMRKICACVITLFNSLTTM